MGLDMYLEKTKRVEGITPDQLVILNNYFDFLKRPESNRNSSMKEWCGCNIEDVNQDMAKSYISEYIHRYSSWDTEKAYGFKTIFQSVAVWRKANHIHKWFVDNIQGGNDDCGTYEVSKEVLCNLIEICKQVKGASNLIKGKIQNGYTYKNGVKSPIWVEGEYIDNSSIATALLPTQEGFFFGGTEYDQWYLEDINYTITTLEKVVNEIDFNHEIVMYSSSW